MSWPGIDLRRPLLLTLLALSVEGCTYLNQRLNPAEVPVERRQLNATRAALAADLSPLVVSADKVKDVAIRPTHRIATTTPSSTRAAIAGADPRDDGFFVGVAISGGGSRSANFAAACMFQLRRLGLLQRADYISSVSGGSLAAAFYCASTDEEWNPGRVQRKLTHSFASDLMFTTFVPWNFVWMALSDWDRSDALADSFKHVLFTRDKRELTFGDLRADRPRLLINATDLQSGKSFIFCNEMFDQLNADLSKYPLAHAVAASSAVPVLLHQVTLRDFNTTFEQYRHLVDGGVVDNLGVKTLVETYRAQLRADADAYPKGAVFIVIDAKTNYDAKISSRGDTNLLDTLKFGAGVTSTVLLNRASSATLAEIILDSSPDNVPAATLRKERDQLMNEGYVRLENIDGRPVHVLHLALSRVNDVADLPFQGYSESVNNIQTYFNISNEEAAHLYQAADLLVRQRFPGPLKEIGDALEGAGAATRPATAPAQ
jgi:predicted acylesterase/phospholipase RssA